METLVYLNSLVLEYLLQREEWDLDTLTVVTPGGPIFFSKVCLPPLQQQLFPEQLLSVSNYLDLCYLQYLYVGIVYPIVGAWKWGGGFLDAWGFYDFAGSTLVHSVGGWGALITIYLLGARIGKFDKDGKPKALPGHSLPIASAGVFILWLGWFGFNGGSVLSADPELTSLTLVTTSLAAAAGGLPLLSFQTYYTKILI